MILTLLAVLTMAATIQAITRVFVLGHVEKVEREDILRRTEGVRHVIELLRDDFTRQGKDWSDWDELEAFALGKNPDFAKAYLNYQALTATEWDIVAILDSNQRLIWGGQADHQNKTIVPLPTFFNNLLQSTLLRAGNAAENPLSELAVSGAQPYFVAARGIRKTAPQNEPVAGKLIYARIIDPLWIARLREYSLTQLELRPTSSPPLDRFESEARHRLESSPFQPIEARVSAGEARGYVYLSDFEGKPRLLLKTVTDRRLIAMGQRILDATLYALAIGGFGLLMAAIILVRQGLIAPLRKLRDAVRNLEQGKHTAVILERSDELGDLASGFNRMARTIRERETTLRQAHAELKLILDSTADALCGCTLTGGFRGAPSAMGPKWFGEPKIDQDVASWLFGNQPSLVAIFRLGLAQVIEDKLPLSVTLDQLPQRFNRSNRSYEVVYQPIREGEDTIGLLLVIKDVTLEVRADQSEREGRELQIVIGNLVRDKPAFDHFVEECEALLRQMHTETTLSERLVLLHTLKGACSIFGLLSFSEACQQLEAEIALNAESLNEEALRKLRRSFQSTLNRVKRFAPNIGEERLSISLKDYSNFVELLEKRLGHERLLAEARRLPLDSGERLLGKLVQHAQRIAQELNKSVNIEIDDGGLRLVAESTQLLWASLVHGVRNAIEHGIEPEAERLALGKSPHGNLRIVLREQGQHLAVSVIDDGRGIDWPLLEKRAYASRLPSTREDLVELLFTDGLSTKAQTSSISGRGIGLSAIRATCHALGGTCIVYAGPDGVGTELYCTISMAVATHPSSGTRSSESHTRLTASTPPTDERNESLETGALPGSRWRDAE